MLPHENYLPLDASARPGAETASTTSEFLLRCLLGAREEADFHSNRDGFDEDVNVYLVGLLQSFLSPAYHEEVSRYLRMSDIDLSREVARAQDDRLSFRLYKINADHLLLAVGLFRNTPGGSVANPLTYREPESYVGRGGMYYRLASSSLRRLHRRATAPEVAMDKLGERFGEYAQLLNCVRTSYFHLTERIGDGSLYHLMENKSEKLDAEQIASLYDGFLDAYSGWQADPCPQTRTELEESVERLRSADPDFAFQMPSDDESEPTEA